MPTFAGRRDRQPGRCALTRSRRFMPPLVLLTGLAVLAALLVIPWAARAQSQEVTATAAATGESPPAKANGLQASAEHDEVSLTWTVSTDQTVTHYAVLRRDRGTDALGVFHVIENNAGSGTGYTDGSVSAEGSYVYRVKAVSPTGVSQWSGYVRADTPAAPEPTPTAAPTATATPTPEPAPEPQTDPADLAPTGLSAALAQGGGVALSWDAPEEDADSVTGYEILRAVGEGEMATLADDTVSTTTAYTDATATDAGETYAYQVKAIRGEDRSRASYQAQVQVPHDAADLAPTGLTALFLIVPAVGEEGSTTDIRLGWTTPAGEADTITGYEILRAVGQGEFTTLKDDTASTTTAYTDATATDAGETYAYQVKAIRGDDRSQASGQAQVRLPHDPVDLAPSNLTAEAVDGGVGLSWTAPAEDTGSVTGYEVLRAVAEGEMATLVADTASTATAHTDATATETGETYAYQVKAIRGEDRSEASGQAQVQVPHDPVDLAPSSLTAEAVDGGVDLSWTAPAENTGSVTGYEVLRAVGEGEMATLVANTAGTDTAHTDATATGTGETYAYEVRAVRGDEHSQSSNRVSVGLPETPVPACELDPGAGDLPADTSTGCALAVGGSVLGERGTADDVDWFRVGLQARATYQFDMRGRSTGGWQLVDGEPAFVSVGTLEDPKLLGIYDASGVLVPGTDSEVPGTGKDSRIESFTPQSDGVYFVSASAESGWTGTYELSLTVTAGEHVADLSRLAPSGLSASLADGGGVALGWTAPGADAASVDGYRILRGEGEGEMSALVSDTESTATAHSDATAEAGTTYVYQVSALRGEAASQGSDTASITIPPPVPPEPEESGEPVAAEQVVAATTPPGQPRKLRAISVTHAAVELGWTAPEGAEATGYQIRRRPHPEGSFTLIATLSGSASTSYTDIGVSPSTGYVYQVMAYNPAGVGDPSADLRVLTPDAPEAVGGFRQVDAGWGHICALRMDGTVHCWGEFVRRDREQPSSPEGTFTQIVAGNDSSCGIRTDASALCWDDGQRLGPIANDQPKRQIHTYTQTGVCWVNQDGTVGCAGDHHQEPNESNYTLVTTGYDFACALTVGGDVVCWNGNRRLDPPPGSFSFIQAGGSRVCGIRQDDDPDDGVDADGDLLCWGVGEPHQNQSGWYSNSYYLETTAPEGKFRHVDLHYAQTCGVTTGGDIKCWMRDDGPATSLVRNVPRVAPAGVFSDVSIDWYMNVCALRTDRSITCWKGTGEEVWTPAFDSPWKDNAGLLELELSGIEFSFDPETLNYAVQVDSGVSSTTVKATATNTQANVSISPGRHEVDLSTGPNTIAVKVTAADGETTRTYRVTVTRAAG